MGTNKKKKEQSKFETQKSLREQRQYEAHLQSLKEAHKKIDCDPPHLPADSFYHKGKLASYNLQLTALEKKNRELVQHINIIYRTKGRVDNKPSEVVKCSNYRHRQQQYNKQHIANLKIYEELQNPQNRYSRKCMEDDYQEKRKLMIFNARYPEFYDKPIDPLEQWTICPIKMERPPMCNPPMRVRCFFDVEIQNDRKLGRIYFDIYKDFAPIASDNFISFCRGTPEKKSYKGTIFHRIVPDLVCMGGDVDREACIRTPQEIFPDENYLLRFAGPGVISTYNFEKGKNNSQFLITFKEMQTLNGRFVVFGRIIKTLRVLRMIEEYGSKTGKPHSKVVISNCGVVGDKKDEKLGD